MTEQELLNVSWFKRSTLLGMMDREELYTRDGDTGVFVKMPYSRYMLNKEIHFDNVFTEKVKVGVT
jgi:hypothetical protein